MNLEEYKGVWIFAEQRLGRLQDVGLELLGEGRALADKLGVELSAVLVGSGVAPLAQEIFAFGADKVYLADNLLLENYQNDAYAPVLRDLVQQFKPEILLLGATSMGRDLAPTVAAKLNTGLSSDCTGLDIDEERQLRQIVPAFGGAVMATIICPQRRPQIATVRPGIARKAERKDRQGELVMAEIRLSPEDIRTRVVEVFQEEAPAGVPLEQAEVVVAGGWGVGSAENWRLVEELAASLNAAVGATRPSVDEGWCCEGQMIGQSGKIVRPKLYISIGISGDMHHLVGIKDSKVVVSINPDPKAPIIEASDLVYIGEFQQIVPCLIEEIRKQTY